MLKFTSEKLLARSVLVCAASMLISVGCKTAANDNTGGGAGGMVSSFPTGTGVSSQLPTNNGTGTGGAGSTIVTGSTGGAPAPAGTGGFMGGTGGVTGGGMTTPGTGIAGTGAAGMGTAGMGTAGMGTAGMGTAGMGMAGSGASDPCTMMAVAKNVPMACASCACSMKMTETNACSADANCWALIACIRDMCMGNSMDTTCILSNCSSSVGGATPAMGIGPTLTGPCMAQCQSSSGH